VAVNIDHVVFKMVVNTDHVLYKMSVELFYFLVFVNDNS